MLAAAEPPGIQVVLVTARPPQWPQDTADLVGHQGLVLCSNAAFVYDVRSCQVLENHSMADGDVRMVAVDLRNALPGVVLRSRTEWVSRGSGTTSTSSRHLRTFRRRCSSVLHRRSV